MTIQIWTFMIVGITFAIYIGIVLWSRAASTKAFYVADGGMVAGLGITCFYIARFKSGWIGSPETNGETYW